MNLKSRRWKRKNEKEGKMVDLARDKTVEKAKDE